MCGPGQFFFIKHGPDKPKEWTFMLERIWPLIGFKSLCVYSLIWWVCLWRRRETEPWEHGCIWWFIRVPPFGGIHLFWMLKIQDSSILCSQTYVVYVVLCAESLRWKQLSYACHCRCLPLRQLVTLKTLSRSGASSLQLLQTVVCFAWGMGILASLLSLCQSGLVPCECSD